MTLCLWPLNVLHVFFQVLQGRLLETAGRRDTAVHVHVCAYVCMCARVQDGEAQATVPAGSSGN